MHRFSERKLYVYSLKLTVQDETTVGIMALFYLPFEIMFLKTKGEKDKISHFPVDEPAGRGH